MAGDWIKWVKGLPDKPEVVRLSGMLTLPREAVVCRLMKFWEWCDDNIPDDAIADSGSAFVTLSPRDGDNAAFLDTLVGTPKFADSLADVGWLRLRNGRVELPNFGRHNLETAKTRARNAKTQKKKRRPKADGKEEPPNDGVTEMSPRDGDKKVTRGEERREEEKTKNEESASQTADAARPPPKPSSIRKEPTGPHHEAIRAFCTAWEAKYGTKYPFAKGKDGEAVKWILEQCGSVEKFTAATSRYLADDDPFYKGHTLTMFRGTLPKWLTEPPPTTNGKPFSSKPSARESPEEMAARITREAREKGTIP